MKSISTKTKLHLFYSSIMVLISCTIAISQNCIWTRQATGTGNCVATDAAGNAYVAGIYSSRTITFGSYILTNNDSTGNTPNIFLVKYDGNGNALWARTAGASTAGYDVRMNCIAVDSAGNIYIAGAYSMAIYFGSDSLNNNALLRDIFLAKYDKNGNRVWVKSFGGGGDWNTDNDDVAYSLACNRKGEIYMTGYFDSNTLHLGTTALVNSGRTDLFIAKFNKRGGVIWAKDFGGLNVDYGNSVATDSIGNVYLAGSFGGPGYGSPGGGGTITFGNTTLTNFGGGYDDMFITKLDSLGNVRWAKSAGGSSADRAVSIATDKFSNVFVAGYFNSPSIIFGTTTLTNTNINADIFLTKYDSLGNVLWAKSKGGANYDQINSVAVDISGNAYISGYIGSAGGGFVTRYNSGGNVTWSVAPCAGAIASVATDSFGNLFAAGGVIAKMSQCAIPAQPGSVTGSSLICANSAMNYYSINPVALATSYSWALPNGFIGTSTTNSISVSSGNTGGNISVTANNSCGSSIVKTLALTLKPSYTVYNAQVICNGGSYTINSHTYTTANTYHDTLQAFNSCDSIIVTLLRVNPAYSVNNPRIICNGGSYTINSHRYTTANTYHDTLQAFNSCDSIVITTLTVNPSYIVNNPQIICNGGSYRFNSHTYTTANTYRDTLRTVKSCDSIIVTTLTVNPTYRMNNPQIICNGGSYSINSHTYTTANTYYDTLQTIKSCDSIIVTALTVNPTYRMNNPQRICNGDSYTINNHTYTNANTYHDTLHTIKSCDSIIITALSVTTVDTSVSVSGIVLTANASSATYQWFDCYANTEVSGATNQTFTPTANGSYSVVVTQNTCSDTSACRSNTSLGINENSNEAAMTIYPIPSAGKFTIETKRTKGEISIYDIMGERVYSEKLDRQTLKEIDLSSSPKGIYFVKFYDGEKIYNQKIIFD